MSYGPRWKAKTMRACQLRGAKRAVMGALLILCDWRGRVSKPYHEIAEIAGISARHCFAHLHDLIDAHYVLLLHRGQGRRPSMFQVVPADQISGA